MSDNQKRQLVPRLRFPEFRDAKEWNVEPLDKVARLVKKKISLDELQIEDYVSTENMLPDYGGIEKAKKFPPSGSATHYKADDILIANIRPYLKKVWRANKSGGASNDVIVIRPKPVILNDYFTLIIANDYFINYLMKTAKGVKMPRGDIASVKAYDVYYPEPSEQQKIADCLSSLDELIAAEGRKLAALRDHKKGLMQQLFPREGETRPRLRFPEFRDAGEWEKSTVGSKCESFSGGTPDTTRKDYYGGTIPFIRSAEISSDTTKLFLTEEGLKSSAAKMVTRGDVLVALYGANSGEVALARVDGAINQAILCLRPEGSKGFLYHYLTQKKAWIIATYLQGGQGNLSGDIVKSVLLRFPCLEEQETIANCLSSLDALITAQAEKLDALRTHKRGLMQQLFPMPEDV